MSPHPTDAESVLDRLIIKTCLTDEKWDLGQKKERMFILLPSASATQPSPHLLVAGHLVESFLFSVFFGGDTAL